MQLFTMFTEDDRALEHVVRDKRRIAAILKRIEHRSNGACACTLDAGRKRMRERRAAKVGAAPPEDRRPPPRRSSSGVLRRFAHRSNGGSGSRGTPTRRRSAAPRHRAPRSGADYLVRKREQRDLAQARLKQARTQANRMYRAVSREATAAHRRTATEQAAPGSRLLLDAAFLVPARRATPSAPRSAATRGCSKAPASRCRSPGRGPRITSSDGFPPANAAPGTSDGDSRRTHPRDRRRVAPRRRRQRPEQGSRAQRRSDARAGAGRPRLRAAVGAALRRRSRPAQRGQRLPGASSGAAREAPAFAVEARA